MILFKVWSRITEASQMVLVVKNSPANVGDAGSIPGSGRPLEEGMAILLQYSCLENPIDRGAWWAAVHRVTQKQTRLKGLIQQQQHII